jgi:hypothetical protein
LLHASWCQPTLFLHRYGHQLVNQLERSDMDGLRSKPPNLEVNLSGAFQPRP